MRERIFISLLVKLDNAQALVQCNDSNNAFLKIFFCMY